MWRKSVHLFWDLSARQMVSGNNGWLSKNSTIIKQSYPTCGTAKRSSKAKLPLQPPNVKFPRAKVTRKKHISSEVRPNKRVEGLYLLEGQDSLSVLEVGPSVA